MQKKKPTFSMAGKTVPWYMVVFVLLFVAVLFFDFEHRQKQRFEDMNQQMEKLAVILRDTRRAQSAGGVPALGGGPAASSDARLVNFAPSGSKLQAAAAGASSSSNAAGRVGRELSDGVVSFIYPDSFSRGNNTNFFWPYARQKSPEDVYRFLGTVDVEELAEVVKTIPQSIWAEGDERSKKYKVHQYTSTIAFRLGGDHLREMPSKLAKYQGKKSTYDILNFDGSMTFSNHWETYGPLIQPVLDKIASTFPHSDRTWLRVLLVRLDAKHAVSQHRDNGCWMRVSRRIHVPLITHDQVTFHASNLPKGKSGMRGMSNAPVEDELLPVNTPGNIIELNNAMTHYVNNDAPVDRIHLIVDYMADVPNELEYDEALCIFANDYSNCQAAGAP
eukprot:INCI7015.3.p1 GENE.INCI7015.3~~INCI7015.3.p1  ORF type:complete len:389 (+),score=75.30 INCI7015.3:184-1350(+)